jgi:hypothetical protein
MEVYAYMCTRNVVLKTVHINTIRVVPEREERCLATEDPKAALTKPSVHVGQRESPVELRVVSGRVHGGRVCQARRSHGLANRLARRRSMPRRQIK